MKKVTFILAICLGLCTTLTAQNVWDSTFELGRAYLSVSSDGNVFKAYANSEHSGITYSPNGDFHDWYKLLESETTELYGLTVSRQGRVFVLPSDQNHVLYTDDLGEIWHQSIDFLEHHIEKAPMYAVSNDTLLVYDEGMLHWTFDAGTTWNATTLPFIEERTLFGDMIVDEYFNVFISTYNWLTTGVDGMGIFNASLQHLDQWNTWALVPGGVKDLELDRLQNVYATTNGAFEHPNYRLYLVPTDRIGIANDGTVFTTLRVDYKHVVLAYSTDYGEHFTQFGEMMSASVTTQETNASFIKGLDEHLYCAGTDHDSQGYTNLYRSNHIADNIISGLPDYTWDELVTSWNPNTYEIDVMGNVEIWSEDGLAWLISTVNGLNGQEPDDFAGRKVTLHNDLNMSGAIWTTIGQGTNYGNPNPDRLKFCGTFDGDNHVISNLYLYSSNMEDFSSFFGDLCGARIENVRIKNTYATGRSDRDGLFFANADAQTVINNCRFEVDEVFKSDMNMDYSIFGYKNDGTITNCMSRCKKVDYEGHESINMDMFVRFNNGTIQNCASVADSLKFLYSYGGIAGTNNGLIENCYSYIETFFGDYEIWWPPTPRQGVCFTNHGTIRNCYYNHLEGLVDNAAYVNDGTIEQTSSFVWRDRWMLDDDSGSLIDALNTWVNAQSGIYYKNWCNNAYFLGYQLPEFGNYSNAFGIYNAPSDYYGYKYSYEHNTCRIHFSWTPPKGGHWFNYDENPYEGLRSYVFWGIRIPAEEIQSGDVLTHVSFYKVKSTFRTEICVFAKGGDDTPPGNPAEWPLVTDDYVEAGPEEWVTLKLKNPLTCEEGKSVWLVFMTPGWNNSASYCQSAGNHDARWATRNGYDWVDCMADGGVGGDWMIRGYFSNDSSYGSDFDHYNIYRGRSLTAMEKLIEVDKDSTTCDDVLYAPFGGYFYRLTAAYADGGESVPALTYPYGFNYLSASFENIAPLGSEWYYEIENGDGSITYQHLEYASDTTIVDKPVKILIKINTLYDKGICSEEVSREYIYEDDGKVFWWNKTLGEFTVLYDLNARPGDSWEIKVGTNSLVMHVDGVEDIVYEGITYQMLHVSDKNDLFSGDIVNGIGHLTSFFPERLMEHKIDHSVDGIRCYWRQGDLMFTSGDRDCDEIYNEYHFGVDEIDSENGFTVYPNPTSGILIVETRCTSSLQRQTEYRITNLTGQTLMKGQICSETQQINISILPEGIYFLTIASKTQKIIIIK